MKGYIDKIRQKIRLFPPKKEGQSGEEYARQRVFLGLKYGVFALTAFAILRGMIVAAGENMTVTSSVDGRELPIYCVDTPEKKIALSFDAAWGNGWLMDYFVKFAIEYDMIISLNIFEEGTSG